MIKKAVKQQDFILEEADLLKIIDKAVSVNLIASSGEGECQLYE